MKKIVALLVLFSFVSCAEKPLDVDKAKKVVETLIVKTDQREWESIEDLYTAEFNSSEPFDIKKDKLIRLRDTLGALQSMEFMSATNVAEFGRPQQVIIKYRIVHSRMTSIETFTVEEDEGGYKVAAYLVESEK